MTTYRVTSLNNPDDKSLINADKVQRDETTGAVLFLEGENLVAQRFNISFERIDSGRESGEEVIAIAQRWFDKKPDEMFFDSVAERKAALAEIHSLCGSIISQAAGKKPAKK